MRVDLVQFLTSRRELSEKADHKGVFILFGYPNIASKSQRTALFALAIGFLIPGCAGDETRGERDGDYYTDQSRAVFAPDLDPNTSTEPQRDSTQPEDGGEHELVGGWSIVLTKAESMAQARQQLAIIREQAGLDDARVEQRPIGLVVVYGDYMGREDEQAQNDLKRFRAMEVGGARLFESAIITPPTSRELRGSNPRYDLRTVKERFGSGAVYTLQIGVYGRGDYRIPSEEELIEYRRAAEQAVRDLRADGEMAFYYHAPARSMVTVGVFGERDFDATMHPPFQSPQLRAVRERFPNNLLNGQGINETIRMESGRVTQLQSSQLVAIPEN